MIASLLLSSTLFSATLALQTLFELGCDGGLTVMSGVPGGPFESRTNGFNRLINFLEEQQSSGSCSCDALTEEALNKHFRVWNPEFAFNALSKDSVKFDAPQCELPSLDTNGAVSIDWPTTCSPTTWKESGFCHLQMSMISSKVALVVRLEKCAASSMPYVRVACEGDDCPYVFAPCSVDSECPDALTCAGLTDFSNQCARETCTAEGSVNSVSVSATQCSVPDAGQAVPPSTGCVFNGVTYGDGFTFYEDTASDAVAEPQSEEDVKECVRKTCQGTTWSEQGTSASRCFDALMLRGLEEDKGELCVAPRVKNELWPLTRDNTCNWDSLRHGSSSAYHGIDTSSVKPFFSGSTRYVSNVAYTPGVLFSYDSVDLAKLPFGCRTNEEMMESMKSYMRGVFDRAASMSATTLQKSNVLGVCVPGNDYELQRSEATPFFSTSITSQAFQNEPDQVLKNEFGVECVTTCDDVNGQQQCTFSCPKDELSLKEGKPLTAAEKFDTDHHRRVRSVEPVTPGATVLGHLGCDGSMTMFPNHATMGQEFAFRGVYEFFHWFRKEQRESFDCRATTHNGQKLSEPQFNARSFTLDNILYFVTSPVATTLTDIGVPFRDFRVAGISNDMRMKMPKTCTYDEYRKTGQCRLKFTGMSQALFFDEQTDLNIMASVCPGSFMPELYMECVGAGCAAFNGPVPCSSASECPAKGMKCESIRQIYEDEGADDNVDEPNFSFGFRESFNNAMFITSREPQEFDVTNYPPQQRTNGVITVGYSELETYMVSNTTQLAVARFVSSIDISTVELSITFVQFAGGVPPGAIKLFEGPYTGQFTDIRVISQECGYDEDNYEINMQYDANSISMTVACTCSLGRKRSVKHAYSSILNGATTMLNSALHSFTAHPVVRALTKRQPVAESGDSAVNLGGLLVGLSDPSKPGCDTTTFSEKTVSKLLHHLADKDDTGKTSFCFVDTTTKTAAGKQQLETWAESQVTLDGDTIELVFLEEWGQPETVIKPVDGGTTIKQVTWKIDKGEYAQDKWESVYSAASTAPPDTTSANAMHCSVIALLVAMVRLI